MTIPGGYVSGDVLTAANLNLLPAGVEGGGYAQVTASQTGISAVTDLTSLTVTFTAVAGRRYRASAQFEIISSAGSPDIWLVSLKEGATTLHRATDTSATTASESNQLTYVNNASIGGSKTWKLTLERVSGTGTFSLGAAATYPAFLLIEDIGEL